MSDAAADNVVVIEPRFRLIPFADLRPGTEPPYLVRGLIPRNCLAVAWGPPKCGKSFWAYDLAMHVALGWDYRRRRVHRGPVVYVAFEGADGFKKRAEAFRRRYLPEHHEPIDFYLIAVRADLVADHVEMIGAIRAQLGGKDPVLVNLDTLNRSLSGSESSDEDMAAYVRAADAIREAFACAVLIIHHCGIDGTRPRGHTSLTGAADVQLAVKKDDANNVVVTIEWMKDGPEGDTILSRLERIELGTDADGDTIDSCIVVPVDASLTPVATTKTAKLTKAAQIALRALAESIDERGEPAPPSTYVPPNARVVTVATWRQQAYSRGISSSEEDRAMQQAFRRAYEHLVGIGRVGAWEGLVWLAI
jgi:AAA domain